MAGPTYKDGGHGQMPHPSCNMVGEPLGIHNMPKDDTNSLSITIELKVSQKREGIAEYAGDFSTLNH